VKSELYAYNLVNCFTNTSNEYVSQFWKFYRGTGLPNEEKRNKSAIDFTLSSGDQPLTASTIDYLRFVDLQSKCPTFAADYGVNYEFNNTESFGEDFLVSRYGEDSFV
jgi:hypothetical protein